MALIQSEWASGIKMLCVSGEAGNVVANRFVIEIADLPTLTAGDIIEIGGLPAHHEIVDWVLDNDSLDSGATADVDVGIMTGGYGEVDETRQCGDELFDGSTLLQSANVTRGSQAAGFRVAQVGYDRGIGMLINTAPGTQTTTGQIILTVTAAQ
jgi:hypothetical protein